MLASAEWRRQAFTAKLWSPDRESCSRGSDARRWARRCQPLGMPRWRADRVPYRCKEPLPVRPLQYGLGRGLIARLRTSGPHDWGSVRENLTYCVILPAYNEGRHLATVVSRIPDWVSGIIIVDDDDAAHPV